MNTWHKKYWLLIAAAVFIADRTTKVFIALHLLFNHPTAVFPHFNLFFTLNSGAAFSFLSETSNWHSWLFMVVGVAVGLLIVFWQLRIANNRLLQIALALILGGTLGNLYDRIIFGYVIDFLDFYYAAWHFPAFNLADTAICVGTMMLVVDMVREKKF